MKNSKNAKVLVIKIQIRREKNSCYDKKTTILFPPINNQALIPNSRGGLQAQQNGRHGSVRAGIQGQRAISAKPTLPWSQSAGGWH